MCTERPARESRQNYQQKIRTKKKSYIYSIEMIHSLSSSTNTDELFFFCFGSLCCLVWEYTISRMKLHANVFLFLFFIHSFLYSLSFKRRWWWTSGLDFHSFIQKTSSSSRLCGWLLPIVFHEKKTKNKKTQERNRITFQRGWAPRSLSSSFFCGLREFGINLIKQIKGKIF